VHQFIPGAHKIALLRIPQGNAVRRYGQVIGLASRDIEPGEHVHTHNLDLGDLDREYRFDVDARPLSPLPPGGRRTFLGYKRTSGRVGTRNYVAVISTVNCSAHACLEIAHHFTPERLAPYANVDGVVALTFRNACSMRIGGPTHTVLQRTLAGMARHANVGATIFVGLGCETNQATTLVDNYGLDSAGGGPPPILSIQELGGLRPTIDAGVAAVQDLLPRANAIERTSQPLAELMLALQCGGSDGWSGVTANPMVGLVADELVRQGGTVVLAETTEIYGAEHLLTRRAVQPQVGQKLLSQVRWWEEHARLLGTEIDNNPTFGNKAGGLTTIYEKALGAVAKSGQTPLVGVYEYAEPVTQKGFVFMDSPGYDPVAVTGQVASGCNLVLFTTGRGSVFGFKPAPSIKIASNSDLYQRMIGDMDVDAGVVLAGADMQQVANQLLDLVIAVASGQPSKSEAQGVGEAEFSPWHLGETL
jgi:altronate hydrolase